MTFAGDDVELVSSATKRREVTSHHHICVLYVMLTLCILTTAACLALLCGVRQRQSLIEDKMDLSSMDGGCCKCCQRLEERVQLLNLGRESHSGKVDVKQTVRFPNDPSDDKATLSTSLDRNIPRTLSLENNRVQLSGDRGRTSSPATDVELRSRVLERSRYFARTRRDLKDAGNQSSNTNSTSTVMENSAEVDDHDLDLDIATTFNLTTIAPKLNESDAEKTVPHEFETSQEEKSGLNDIIPSLVRPPRQSTEGPAAKQRSKSTKKKPTKQRKGTTKQATKSDLQSQHHLAAIHLQAPDHFDRKYESGPVISLNTSNTRDTVYRFWQKASWVEDRVSEVFDLDEVTGHVTVEVEGVYMIYAQVVYHDLSGRWSFGVYVGDQERVKCLATEQLKDLDRYHPTSHGVYHSCYTAIVLHIRRNQSVSIRCLYGSRTILTRPEFTFWGIVRLS